MSNMGYCRFQNTLLDLRDCYNNMEDGLGPEEQKARLSLIRLCVRIANDYGEEVQP